MEYLTDRPTPNEPEKPEDDSPKARVAAWPQWKRDMHKVIQEDQIKTQGYARKDAPRPDKASKGPTCTGWKQKRPMWCPYQDCIFLRQTQGLICGGKLPKPELHDGCENTHRLCISPGEASGDLQLNNNDCDGFRFILDALDGKKTSWRSKLKG